MSTPTTIQTIMQNGKPAFVVIPYDEFRKMLFQKPRIPQGDAVPHEVISLTVRKGFTLLRAWREYLGLTQVEVARSAGISQAALSQMESGEKSLRKATREKLAQAMGLNSEQVV
ncbi:MAG: helix-turn-helix transcriptional regulator [Deltaproteobacteria bacterium]|nr:helix-turn-helix transcriptional regulator [Deltaproteobacteria bacterium]